MGRKVLEGTDNFLPTRAEGFVCGKYHITET